MHLPKKAIVTTYKVKIFFNCFWFQIFFEIFHGNIENISHYILYCVGFLKSNNIREKKFRCVKLLMTKKTRQACISKPFVITISCFATLHRCLNELVQAIITKFCYVCSPEFERKDKSECTSVANLL